MSWSLLSFALPAFGLLKVFAQSNPASYKKFDDMPQSDQPAAINAILERVLNAENVRGSEYFERIEDMLKELPDSAGPKIIESLLSYRLKIAFSELIKERRASGTYANNLITCILHPSENSRIAKIRAVLGLAGKAKLA